MARKIGKKSTPPARKRSRAASTAPESPPPSETPQDAARLRALRQKIDALDIRLVRLLNERASLVVQVGRTKRAQGIPIYAPHREAEVLRKALAANRGPLLDRTIEGVFRELMSGSFALEQPLRIGYLGPPGSHSHAAAVKQFGASVDYEDLHEIGGVFTEVRRGHVNYGLVPIENSLGGGILETLDAFKANAHQISIYGEVQITIHHALLANCEPRQVRRIHSKPEIFQQCRNWLSTQYPGVELMPAVSSSRAAQVAADECRKAQEIGAEPGSAAIGTMLAGHLYDLNVLFPRIEDDPNNVTRFVIIARQNARPTGDDKTSIMFTTDDSPGALVSVLGVFQAAGINLTHIDKRPRGLGENWAYTFFVDALGHREEPKMADTIEQARAHCRELFILGSYPRSRRIL